MTLATRSSCFLDGSPSVRRLFPDYEALERDYYRRTGIFPIMHPVVVRRALLAEHPDLARAIYGGFCAAKEIAADEYQRSEKIYHADRMVAWLNHLVEENRRTYPDDWWPYGVAANRETVDTYLRYHVEQGLSKRRFTCEDVFFPDLLET